MSKQTFSYLIFAAILRLLSPVRGQVGTEDSSGFFVDSNGVVVCPDAELGATSSLNIGGTATVFTRASREDLMNIVAAAAWPELGKVCTSGITDMSNLFLGQTQFGATDDETLGANVDLSRWDVSSVENMDAMFYDAKSFNKDLSKWDTSMVTSCDKFADRASSWTEPWPVFQNCSPTGRFVLGPNGVTVSCPDAVLMESAYIRNKRYTKRDRDLLEELITARRWSEVAATCTTGIDDLSNLFLGEERFDEDIRSWDVSSVSNMAAMFYDASSFNHDLSVWNVDGVTSCEQFADGTSSWTLGWPNFSRCAPSKFYKHENGVTVLCPEAAVLETGTIDGIEYTKRDLQGAYGLRYLAVDSSRWDLLDRTCISGVKSLASLFVGAAVLGKESGSRVALSSWDTSQVTDMSYMFAGASHFNENISMWDVGMVEDMGNMFIAAHAFNQDVGSWNTSSVTKMNRMFYEAGAFNQDIGGWDTSSVGSMHGMFADAAAFNQDLSGWSVDNVQDCSDFSTNAASWVEPKPPFPVSC